MTEETRTYRYRDLFIGGVVVMGYFLVMPLVDTVAELYGYVRSGVNYVR